MALTLLKSIEKAQDPRKKLLTTVRKIERDGIKTVEGFRVIVQSNPKGEAYLAFANKKNQLVGAMCSYSSEVYAELNRLFFGIQLRKSGVLDKPFVEPQKEKARKKAKK